MLLFSEPRDPQRRTWRERPFWRTLLFIATAASTVAAMRPWIEVQFVSLFGELSGPPGWRSSAGFTCLCTSALVCVMTLAETQTPTSRQAVRPASMLLSIVMTSALFLHLLRGPGMLRGVSATWTISFYIGAAASLAVVAACAARYAATVPSKAE